MAANVETMFSVRETPWHGLGKVIQTAPTSEDALYIAGLNWEVKPMPIYDAFGNVISGYKANVRNSDNRVLGLVTNRYKVVQNNEAFAFTDALLGEGVTYETAGSLASGKRVWLLAKTESTLIAEEKMDSYLVFTNSHDGTGAVKVAITPVRVVCQNTLNMALSGASRTWSYKHVGAVQGKLEEARMTLTNAKAYMKNLETEFEVLKLQKLGEKKALQMVDDLVEMEFATLVAKAKAQVDGVVNIADYMKQQKYETKLKAKKDELIYRYMEAPDLKGTEHTAFRFINAVSDYVTHTNDHKATQNYKENLFMKVIDGSSMIDNAYDMVRAVA